MSRPETPLTTDNKALRRLQEWLRDQRKRTGQGYRALAVRAGCHATTLQRAASGETVPKLQTVLNYARACDASPEEVRRLWRRARYEQSRQARGGRGLPAPRPKYIHDFVDLSAAVQDLYEKAGSPTLRTMEQRAGGFGHLPRSTAHRIVTRQAMPRSIQQFQAFLRACEVPESERQGWESAWIRAWRSEQREDSLSLSYMPDAWDLMERSESVGERTRQRYVRRHSPVYGPQESVVTHDGAYRRLALPSPRSEPRPSARGRRSRRRPRELVVQVQLPFFTGRSEPDDPVLF
ncbi:helix-turn-helix transcriptional regulator [Streptomyces sp. NPDC048224]|uniref:helix-turn-helix domain-containing protein n=1 Tax=Streptomyces sp. NPDC048224 TaxID=3154500 RepID=UPI0033C4EE82